MTAFVGTFSSMSSLAQAVPGASLGSFAAITHGGARPATIAAWGESNTWTDTGIRLDWLLLSNTPTTLAGYGITDSISVADLEAESAARQAHSNRVDNPHVVTKAQVGLGNADNTSDANKPISSATQSALDGKAAVVHTHSVSAVTGLQAALDAKLAASALGQANGAAPLDGTSKVPSIYLPGFVDDVVEFADYASLPGTGDSGKIYITTDNNKQFRWSGSTYAEIASSPGSTDAVPEGASNLYHTPTRVNALIAAAVGSVVQAWSATLDSLAALTTTAFGRSALTWTDAAAGRTALQLGTAAQSATGDFDAAGSAASAQAYAVQRGNHTGPQAISTVTGLQTALDLKAPLADAALTGAPTAPTVAGTADASTKIATTAFVQACIAALVNGAPGALDTLKELADQLAADESAVASLTTTVAGKLAKASNLSDLTDASVARTNLGLVIGTNVQAYSANLAAWSGLAPSAKQDALGYTPLNAASNLSDVANAATVRSNLGLVIGTNVQAYSANLASWSALAPSAKQDALGYTPLNAASNLSDVANAATARSNIGAQASLGYTPLNKAGDTATGLIQQLAVDNITARAGGGKASATALTGQINRIATVATAADSALLPASAAGLWVIVINDGANAAQIFGAGTDTINGVATGTGVSQGAGYTTIYSCAVAGKWNATALVAPSGSDSRIPGTTTATAIPKFSDTVGTLTGTNWQVDASGHLKAATDNTYDIGASGASRPKDIYPAGVIAFGSSDATTRNLLTGSSWSFGTQNSAFQFKGASEAAARTAIYWHGGIYIGTTNSQAGLYAGNPQSGTFVNLFRRAADGVWSFDANNTTTGGTYRAVPLRPTQITADQNNYAPGGVSRLQYWSTDASRNITGLSLSQVDGQHHEIWNVGSNPIVLVNESASSTAANRFQTTTGADITLSAKQMAHLRYDNTQARWLVAKGN